jgi:hypothetical protein
VTLAPGRGRRSAPNVTAAADAAWAGYQPSASGAVPKPMNQMPEVVFSDSLASADWGETTIATGDLAEAAGHAEAVSVACEGLATAASDSAVGPRASRVLHTG